MLKDNSLKREPNRAYAELRQKLMDKYEANLLSLSKYHGGMETFIAFAVLCENARAFARGEVKAMWPGAGKVDMKKLCADVKMLDDLAVYQW